MRRHPVGPALVLLALFFVATGELRDQLGLELTAESIRQAVSELGWLATVHLSHSRCSDPKGM